MLFQNLQRVPIRFTSRIIQSRCTFIAKLNPDRMIFNPRFETVLNLKYVPFVLFTPHVSDVSGVIVLTLCVCLAVCPSRYKSQKDRCTDLKFGMEAKWEDI